MLSLTGPLREILLGGAKTDSDTGPLPPGAVVETCRLWLVCVNQNKDKTVTLLRFTNSMYWQLTYTYFGLDYRKTCHGYFHPPGPHYLPGPGTRYL